MDIVCKLKITCNCETRIYSICKKVKKVNFPREIEFLTSLCKLWFTNYRQYFTIDLHVILNLHTK